jgi:hypothetical protein
MATNPHPVEALEMRAERERQRIQRHVAEIRQGIRQRLDVRRMVEASIHERPGAFYGAAAAVAGLIGYIFARLLKT